MPRSSPTRPRALLLGLCLLVLPACSVVGVGGPAEVETGFFTSSEASPATRTLPSDAGATRVDDDDQLWQGPHLGARVARVLVGDELDDGAAALAGLNDGRGFAAPEGSEVVAVQLSAVTTPYGQVPLEGEQPSAAIDLGGRRESIELPAQLGSVVVAGVVRRGDPVGLVLSDAGRTITYDVRAKALADDPESASVRTYAGAASSDSVGGPLAWTIPVEGAPAAFGRVTLDLKLDLQGVSASRQAWTPDAGWAPDGRAWLVLAGLRPTAFPESDRGVTGVEAVGFSLRTDQTFSLTPDGGTTTPARRAAVRAGLGSITANGSTVVVEVPADFTTGALTVRPRGTFSRDGMRLARPGEARTVPVRLTPASS